MIRLIGLISFLVLLSSPVFAQQEYYISVRDSTTGRAKFVRPDSILQALSHTNAMDDSVRAMAASGIVDSIAAFPDSAQVRAMIHDSLKFSVSVVSKPDSSEVSAMIQDSLTNSNIIVAKTDSAETRKIVTDSLGVLRVDVSGMIQDSLVNSNIIVAKTDSSEVSAMIQDSLTNSNIIVAKTDTAEVRSIVSDSMATAGGVSLSDLVDSLVAYVDTTLVREMISDTNAANSYIILNQYEPHRIVVRGRGDSLFVLDHNDLDQAGVIKQDNDTLMIMLTDYDVSGGSNKGNVWISAAPRAATKILTEGGYLDLSSSGGQAETTLSAGRGVTSTLVLRGRDDNAAITITAPGDPTVTISQVTIIQDTLRLTKGLEVGLGISADSLTLAFPSGSTIEEPYMQINFGDWWVDRDLLAGAVDTVTVVARQDTIEAIGASAIFPSIMGFNPDTSSEFNTIHAVSPTYQIPPWFVGVDSVSLWYRTGTTTSGWNNVTVTMFKVVNGVGTSLDNTSALTSVDSEVWVRNIEITTLTALTRYDYFNFHVKLVSLRIDTEAVLARLRVYWKKEANIP